MSKLLRDFELLEPLRSRLADGMPAYGSCAGMILLASEIADAGVAHQVEWSRLTVTGPVERPRVLGRVWFEYSATIEVGEPAVV